MLRRSKNGKKLPFFEPLSIKAGQTLTINQTNNGARCYLGIKGGFQVPLVLNSRSTHVLSKIGGLNGRSLEKNDEIMFSNSNNQNFNKNKNFHIDNDRSLLRVTEGLQYDLFDLVHVCLCDLVNSGAIKIINKNNLINNL